MRTFGYDDIETIQENNDAWALIERLLPSETDKTLYHYSSLAGFLGIIESRQLWATDSRFLNDPTETIYADKILASALEPEIATASEQTQAFFRAIVSGLSEMSVARQVFFTSLSEDPDSLSQWISYSDQGRGCSIGIDGRFLSDSGEIALRGVLYERAAQEDLASQLFKIYVPAMAPAIEAKDYDRLNRFGRILLLALQLCTLCFKDAAYAGEREWRLIHVSIPGKRRAPIRLRVSGFALVPYVELTLSTPPPSEVFQVKEIVIGPALDLLRSQASVELLKELASLDFTVRSSIVPFRFAR